MYVDAGATVTAQRATARTACGPGRSLRDPLRRGGTQTQVFRRQMPAGAWRGEQLIDASVVVRGGHFRSATDFVRCLQLTAGGVLIDGGQTVLINQTDSPVTVATFSR